MQAPIAKTKADDVLEKVSALTEARDDIDPFTLARLKREARDSMGVDAVAAHMALGAIASLEWDDGELDRHHLAAIRLTDDIVTCTCTMGNSTSPSSIACR
ncbi:hypothetical protein LMG8323_03417 [Ralstonia mannitolilytica]|nr:hypothetical protein LMG8323_03417 [Ralstonia mannitolilytica]